MLLYTAICYFRLRREVDTAVLLRDNIRQSENVESPFILGLFRPLIQLLMLAMITTEMRGGELNIAFRFVAGSCLPMVVGVIVAVVGESVFGRGR